MPADAILSSNNNNNNTAKNFQASAPNSTTEGGQFHFSPASHPNPPSQLHQSMSPALGGGGVAAASTGLGPGTVTKTLNQSGITITTTQGSATGPNMLPAGVQIVNMRPGAPTMQHATTTTVQQQQQQQGQQQQLPGQRTVATVQPRIVIGSQNVVTTANNRQATNSLQLGQGPTLLLKTESGQFQLLRVGTAPAGAGQGAGGIQHTLTNPAGIVTTGAGGNQTIRLQTMPASTPTSNIVLTSNATSASNTHPSVASVSSGLPTVVVSSASAAANVPAPTTMVVTAATPQTVQQNTKEKCRKFLANLLDLSSREPKSVEKNVRTLIQELIDNAVEPEGFCHRLERLLNASPQPCLIGFLKKSLPVLRQSLVRKELTIDGIKPPPHNVAFPNAVAIAGTTTTVRPVGGGGQAIIPRMGAPGASPRPTTITRHTPVRIGAAPRLAINQLRPVTAIPALQPVQMRTATPTGGAAGGAMIRPLVPAASVTKVVKVGQAQLKQVTGPQLTAVSGSHVVVSRTPAITTITQRPGAASMGGATIVSASGAALTSSSASTGSAVTPQASAMAAAAQKERKASFYQHNSISSSSIYGDDEINDVAAMGGVNLAEESQRILGSTELIGTQIRSCKDEVFLHLPALQSKIRAIVARHGLEEAGADVAVLVSHAAQERLKNIVEKLAVIAEHRVDVIKLDPRYEVTKDVRGQVKFLEELDKAEQKRHDEQEREMLLRAAKSRTKNEDPEQAKLKAKAKEMQRAEMEELRQRDANLTALQAIGMRKKPRLDGDAATTGTTSGTSGSGTGSGFSSTPLRPRLKRVNLRDMIFYLEQERETCRSSMLYRAYLK